MENGDGQRDTDFFHITVWRGRAESSGKYLKMGSKVAIVGSLQNRSYEDKDGIKRYVTDVVADEVEFLNTPRSEAPAGADKYDKPANSNEKSSRPVLEPVDDNKLPF